MAKMAKKAYKKRSAPKRRRQARPNGFKTTTALSMTAPVRPDRLLVKLPYSEAFTTTLPGGGIGTAYSFNLNSIYDPNRTGTGHQPLGHDQWYTFYSKYRVYGVTYDVSLTNMNADAVIQGGVVNAAGAFGGWTDQAVMEQPHMKRFNLSSVNSGKNQARIRGYVSLPQLRGQTSSQYRFDSTNNEATFNENPNALVCMNVLFRSLNDSALSKPVLYWTVKLTYHTELIQPQPIPVSSTAPSGDTTITFGNTGPTGPAFYTRTT